MRFLFIVLVFFLFLNSKNLHADYITKKSETSYITKKRTNIDEEKNKEAIKINLNEMLDLNQIKKINKKYASIENFVKEKSEKKFKKIERKQYKGKAVDIFKNNADAVVYIGNERDSTMGTGSIIDRNGTILTNWHVVGNASKVQVWLKPEELEKMDERLLIREPSYTGTVIKKNKRKDLALVKVQGFPKDIKFVRLGKNNNLPVGSIVYSIGHPNGQTWTFNSGMVTQIRPSYKWDYEESSHSANIIQHEVPTNPGNSGGPLFNENGMMVGVNSFQKSNSELINFSVSVDEVEKFLKEKIKKKKTKYIEKKKKPAYITKKSKDNKTTEEEGIKKTYPDAIPGDANKNGIDDTWYIDDDKNGKIDTAFVDDNEDGIIEAVMLDVNENQVWEILTIDEDLNGHPDILIMDRDEDGSADVAAYDYDQDGEWDKFENL